MLKKTYDHHFQVDFNLPSDRDAQDLRPKEILKALKNKVKELESDFFTDKQNFVDTICNPSTTITDEIDIPEETYLITRKAEFACTATVKAMSKQAARTAVLLHLNGDPTAPFDIEWTPWEFVIHLGMKTEKQKNK